MVEPVRFSRLRPTQHHGDVATPQSAVQRRKTAVAVADACGQQIQPLSGRKRFSHRDSVGEDLDLDTPVRFAGIPCPSLTQPSSLTFSSMPTACAWALAGAARAGSRLAGVVGMDASPLGRAEMTCTGAVENTLGQLELKVVIPRADAGCFAKARNET